MITLVFVPNHVSNDGNTISASTYCPHTVIRQALIFLSINHSSVTDHFLPFHVPINGTTLTFTLIPLSMGHVSLVPLISHLKVTR